jgi:hypothetical protein
VPATSDADLPLAPVVPVLPAGRAADDPRVRAAAAVLAGQDPAEVAERAGVEVGQVGRVRFGCEPGRQDRSCIAASPHWRYRSTQRPAVGQDTWNRSAAGRSASRRRRRAGRA